jgi:hypothetical protein
MPEDNTPSRKLETPVSTATYAPPPLPTSGGIPKPKFFAKFTPIQVMWGAIIALLILVIIMSGLVIYALTNGAVNVTVNAPGKTVTVPPPTSVVVEPTPVEIEAKETDIYFYLMAFGSDFTAEELPSGAVLLLPASGDFLVPQLSVAAKLTDNPVSDALSALFAVKTAKFEDTDLVSTLNESSIIVEVTKLEDGTLQVSLDGELMPAGDMSPAYMKGQIEQTIRYYTSDFVVQLNGSESEYRCFGDLSGNCN